MQSMLVHDKRVITSLSRGSIIGFVCQIIYNFNIFFSEIIDVHGLMVDVIFHGDVKFIS